MTIIICIPVSVHACVRACGVCVCGRVATGSEVDARYSPQSLSTFFSRVLLNPKHIQQDWMSRKSEGILFLGFSRDDRRVWLHLA